MELSNFKYKIEFGINTVFPFNIKSWLLLNGNLSVSLGDMD